MTHASRCLLFTAPGRIEVSFTSVPAPGPDEVLIRTAWSCVSPGTEMRCLAGLQDGAPEFPFIPGYALTGTVIESCSERLQTGARVFCGGSQHSAHARCWGAHLEFAVVKAGDCLPVPDSLDLRCASSAKIAAIAYHGVRLSAPRSHERVVVLGLGPIGRLSAHLHALAGADVVATDVSATRRAAAAAAGIRIVDAIADLAADADVVVDATGAPPVLAAAASLLRSLPWDDQSHAPRRLLVQGSYASRPPIPYAELFATEARVLIPRDCQRRDLEAVLGFMGGGRLDVSSIVSDADGPENAADTYTMLRERPDTLVTAAFRWSA